MNFSAHGTVFFHLETTNFCLPMLILRMMSMEIKSGLLLFHISNVYTRSHTELLTNENTFSLYGSGKIEEYILWRMDSFFCACIYVSFKLSYLQTQTMNVTIF